MAIGRKPAEPVPAKPRSSDGLDRFIDGAPDGKGASVGETKLGGTKRGNKQQVAITFSPDILSKIDVKAQSRGLTRSAFVSMAVGMAIERDLV